MRIFNKVIKDCHGNWEKTTNKLFIFHPNTHEKQSQHLNTLFVWALPEKSLAFNKNIFLIFYSSFLIKAFLNVFLETYFYLMEEHFHGELNIVISVKTYQNFVSSVS